MNEYSPYFHILSICTFTLFFLLQNVICANFFFQFFYASVNVQSKTTLIFVPQYQYGSKVTNMLIAVSDGKWSLDAKKQTIEWIHDDTHSHVHTIEIKPGKK